MLYCFKRKVNSVNINVMKNDAIKKDILTKEDLFSVIDACLSIEEKRELMNADPADLHFGFGTWIRNEFIFFTSSTNTPARKSSRVTTTRTPTRRWMRTTTSLRTTRHTSARKSLTIWARLWLQN